DEVGASVDFSFEVVEFVQAVRGSWMPFRKARHARAEASARGMPAACVELLDEFDEIRCVLKFVPAAIVVVTIFWGIAAQRQDVVDAGRSVTFENGVDLRLAVTNAGEVRDGIERGFALEAYDQVMREVAGRASRAVGHRNERWLERLELAHGLE